MKQTETIGFEPMHPFGSNGLVDRPLQPPLSKSPNDRDL